MSDKPYLSGKKAFDALVGKSNELQSRVLELERSRANVETTEFVARALLPAHGRKIGKAKRILKNGSNIKEAGLEAEASGLFADMQRALHDLPTGRRGCELRVNEKKAYLKEMEHIVKIPSLTKRLQKAAQLAQGVSAHLSSLGATWEPRTMLIEAGQRVSGTTAIKRILASEVDGYLKLCDGYVSDGTLAILESVPKKIPITLLTLPPSKLDGFMNGLGLMRKEGYDIKVLVAKKNGPFPHDRFLICSSRGWQIGGSLKDVGGRSMTLTLIDAKATIERMLDEYISGFHGPLEAL